MKTLLTGSLAYDTIMVFEDQFKNHILPDQVHILNVSFFTPEMRRYQGGCAGNMAYTLKLLGGDPVIMATVGDDFGPYESWLKQNDLFSDHITHIEGQFTAQAFITTDIDHNQINAFHHGAMNFAHQNKVSDASDISLGIVSPDGRDAMIQHAAQFAEQGIPFLFDPGQGLPMFEAEDLMTFLGQANYAIVNDYECQMMLSKTGLSLQQLAQQVEALIVTRGGKGSSIYVNEEEIVVSAAAINAALDPTGCGDAYRSGLMYGMAKQFDWKSCGQLGALCGAIKIEHRGTQNHHFSQQEFADRYLQSFGQAMPA